MRFSPDIQYEIDRQARMEAREGRVELCETHRSKSRGLETVAANDKSQTSNLKQLRISKSPIQNDPRGRVSGADSWWSTWRRRKNERK
jgi:hypothetical protein